MIKNVRGRSYYNGISFSATKYKVRFESNKNLTKAFLQKNESEKTTKTLDFMKKIPLLRGIASIIRNEIYIFLFLLLDLSDKLFQSNTNKLDTSYLSIIPLIVCFVAIWYVIKIFKSIKSTWKYHGAEHKVIFTNNKDIELTLKNCQNSPRVSYYCGSIFVFLLLFTFIIVSCFNSLLELNMWFSFRLIIADIIAYEVFLMKRNTPFLRYIFKLGYWFQEHISTIEPSNSQLNQAIESFKLLERAETNQIPENELKELLRNGKILTT